MVSKNKGLSWLVGMASVIIILTALKIAESIVVPILLAIFISILSVPFIRLMERHSVPSWLAIMLMLSIWVALLMLFFLMLSNSVEVFSNNLPDYANGVNDLLVELSPLFKYWSFPFFEPTLKEHFSPESIIQFMAEALAGIGVFLMNTFLVLFITIFLLMEESTLTRKFHAAWPNSEYKLHAISEYFKQVNKYILIKTVVSFMTGVLVTLLLMFLDIDFPYLWGVLAMLMNYIPNIGSLVSAVPPVFLALINVGLFDAFMVMSGFIVINVVLGNLIEPRLMGFKFGLSPLVVFLSIMIWGWMFGPVGMILSIPLTMVVQIALFQKEDTRAIAVLLGNKVPE
ncbi:AI-2E family transporter [Hydrogenovibrio sp. 3SP14C1]|uniref:AI-2E family transporter n=1 Tax=Hydrogenovibrio sp. 3SP14C1 TaxID=3038774 RepID=UPI002416DAF9|nr:AI-2E family transporter [Hydrogenovibrio sp. 3SP14C1]MDG4811504.1 AI-2E family transporter [Hydrogenovibrio sp. 3SP14C1]